MRPIARSARLSDLVTGRTVADEVSEAAGRLAGLSDPQREALDLWAAASGRGAAASWLERRAQPRGDVVERFRTAVARRAAGEPFTYVTGWAAFRTLDLRVDARVLIPRPETEGLVERVLHWGRERWGTVGTWGDALDIGTGSGCIALSLATEGHFRRVVGVDLSLAALEVARANTAGLANVRVELAAADLFPGGAQPFDLIVSNPPYVTAAEWTRLDAGVRDFEPRDALISGADGLEHTRRILRGARDRLAPGGLLGIEVDSRRAHQARRLAVQAGWQNARVAQDQFGRPRYLLATKETA